MIANETGRLLCMAEQILQNVAASGEDEAVHRTAEHIRRYWTQAMRRELVERCLAGHQSQLLNRVVNLIS